MTTLHVSTLINFAKEAREKEQDPSLAARTFFCYLVGHISAYDHAQANSLAKALGFEHAMRAINEEAKV